MEGLFLSDAQAACRCNCLGSKLTPFFHMIKVMAAIFRARVRRAMLGRIPFSTRASIEIVQRPGAFDGRDGRPFQEIFQIVIMVVDSDHAP